MEYQTLLDFVPKSCFTISNLKPDKNGKIIIKNFFFKNYSNLTVVATNIYGNLVQKFIVPSSNDLL